MTHQELQALLHDILAEIADIQVTMRRLANDMHVAMNTSAWYSYSEKYYRAKDLLTRREEDVAALEARYYAQFPFTVEQCADIGLPSGATNFYGHDLY
jgi:hypothetical protein